MRDLSLFKLSGFRKEASGYLFFETSLPFQHGPFVKLNLEGLLIFRKMLQENALTIGTLKDDED